MEPFPKRLKHQVEACLTCVPEQRLHVLGRELSTAYRHASFTLTPEHCLAYLAFRMPATYAALKAVFEQLSGLLEPSRLFQSFLDLGTGPGTTLWAYHTVFGGFRGLKHFTGIDSNPSFLKLATHILSPFQPDLKLNLSSCSNLDPKQVPLSSHEVVCLSYVLNELAPQEAKPCSNRLGRQQIPF